MVKEYMHKLISRNCTSRSNFILLLCVCMVLFVIIQIIFLQKSYAESFTATISTNEVGYKQKFNLTVRLQNVKPKSLPDVSSFAGQFEVVSTSRYNSTNIINGKQTTDYQWVYQLRALKKGDLTIPSIPIQTEKGKLETDPVKINVLDVPISDNSNNAQQAGGRPTEIIAQLVVSNKQPYKKEPFLLYLQLYTQVGLQDIRKGAVKINDAIVEQVGEYKIFDRKLNGKDYKLAQWTFHVTPLKSGKIEIPEIEISGQLLATDSLISNFFSSPFDTDGSSGHFGRFAFSQPEEFFRNTEAITLDVQAPVASVNPWLPAKSLKLFEETDDKQIVAGEPFVRTISLHASGLLASQLPDVEFGSGDGEYKIFNDPAKKRDNITDGMILSSKEMKFTIIPKRSGKVTLPEIKITYWNVDKKKLDYAILPAKTLQVAPGDADIEEHVHVAISNEEVAGKENSSAQGVVVDSEGGGATGSAGSARSTGGTERIRSTGNIENAENTESTSIHGEEGDNIAVVDTQLNVRELILYAIIAIVTVLLTISIIRNRQLHNSNTGRKGDVSILGRGDDGAEHISTTKISTIKVGAIDSDMRSDVIDDIDAVHTVKEMQHYLQRYAQHVMAMPANLSVYSILLRIEEQYSQFDLAEFQDISKDIDASLYAGKNIDLSMLKLRCKKLISYIKELKEDKKGGGKAKKLPKLNPL